jgi:hypothetical protein
MVRSLSRTPVQVQTDWYVGARTPEWDALWRFLLHRVSAQLLEDGEAPRGGA